MERDGRRCQQCGRARLEDTCGIVGHGGRNDLNNLQVLCRVITCAHHRLSSRSVRMASPDSGVRWWNPLSWWESRQLPGDSGMNTYLNDL